MSETLETLVRETIELTGAQLPGVMESDAPVLDRAALTSDGETGPYLVGLIGGKEVGKSALVNALAGTSVTISTSFGPGTEQAIAYVHASQEAAVADLLQRLVPGRFRVVSHGVAALRGLALLDLPDIDSHYRDHLQTTRAVLRHLLFPVWVGSIEKYADQQPMRLLTQVAAGNAPENFLFCLNKVDQLGDGNLEELRQDYARRLTRALSLPAEPRVYAISATHPAAFDLPELKTLLMRARSGEAVRESKELAARRQEKSLLTWLGNQDLPARARRLEHLRHDAEETLSARLGPPLLERLTPQLENDESAAMAIADLALEERVARWPLVNLVHTLLSPLFLLARQMTSRHGAAPHSAQELIDARFRETDESVAVLVQSAFGQLRRSHPPIAELYAGRKLWEAPEAEAAADDLSRRLAQTLLRRRTTATGQLGNRSAWGTAPLRWLLTIGAIIWFPFLQPILEALMTNHGLSVATALPGLLVEVLGVNYLLKSAVFLCIWFIVLWLALRWNTQRRVHRLLRRWQATDAGDANLNLTRATLQWMDGLLIPIRGAEERMRSLAQRVEGLETESGGERRARLAG
jgi:hypothetical protein